MLPISKHLGLSKVMCSTAIEWAQSRFWFWHHQFCWCGRTRQSSILLANVVCATRSNSPEKKMERRKVRERQALCRRSGRSFSPFVIKANGVRSGKANQLLQKLVTVSTNNNGCSKRKASFLCRSRLQLALVRGLARQLERGFPL